jgi:pyruvate-formate lyase
MEISTTVLIPETRPRAQLQPATDPEHPFEAELRFTDTYRLLSRAHPAVREAACMGVQYPEILEPIEADDLIAGRMRPRLVGFSPDEWGSCAFGYYHLPVAIREVLDTFDVSPERRRLVEDMVAFWDTESTAARVRAAYPPGVARTLPSDDWMNAHGVAFPLYRLTGANVDYGKLLRLGIPGLMDEVEDRLAAAESTGARPEFFEGLCTALKVLLDCCRHYEMQARQQAADTADHPRRLELGVMADALAQLRVAPPQTFREAAQLMWLYSIVGDVRNHGRLDVHLGPFLARDLDEGRLSEAEALRMVQSLWRLMADRETRVHNRVIIGGVGRPEEDAADRFALLAMEATRTVLEPEPQLSLRFYTAQNPALMAKALDVIAEGRTFPMLYNDDVNVPSVKAAFEVDRVEAEQYVPFGCGEYILEHRSIGTPSGVINLAKALEVTLFDGVDPLTGERMGLPLGRFDSFQSFEQLWDAYAKQVEHHVEALATQQAIEYDVAGRDASFLLLSLLYDDCLERGKPLLSGGVRFLGGTLETYGNTNAADSMTAIKQLVYDRPQLTHEQVLDALTSDFEGHSWARRIMSDAPKYGNDDDVADAMAVRVHEHVCRFTRDQAPRVGLDSYLVVVINNAANTLLGHWTAASADGRRAGTPLNNGNAASSGNDRKGVTAMLNSIVKPSTTIHAGAVQNMKFSRGLFSYHRPEVEALLDTYFALGGAQAMITVVSRGDLEEAMDAPERYQHLFVRVGGFSARFVDLSRDVQMEILQRTLY